MEIVKEYLTDKRIKIINKKNGGISSARNKGIDIATGEYIHFLDSDDYIEKGMYKNIIDNLKDEDIIVFNFFIFDDRLKKITEKKFIDTETEKILLANKRGDIFYRNSNNVCWNKVYKRSYLQKNNLKFNSDIIMYEDEIWSINIFFNTNNVKYLPRSYYIYTVNREKSATFIEEKINKKEFENNRIKKNYLKSYYNAKIAIRNFIENNNCNQFAKLRLLIAEQEYCGRIGEKLIFFNIGKEYLKYLKLKNISNIEKEILINEIKGLLKNKNYKLKLGKEIFNYFYWKEKIFTLSILKRRILINIGVKK